MNFQVVQLSLRLSKLGIVGIGAAAGLMAGYGAYAAVKYYRGKQTPEGVEHEVRTPEVTPAGSPEAAVSGDDHGQREEAAGTRTEVPAFDYAGLTDKKLFEYLLAHTDKAPTNPTWFNSIKLVHTEKYKNSRPRKVSMEGKYFIVFPLPSHLNMTLNSDGVIHYLDDGRRVHVQLNVQDINAGELQVDPANQARAYVYEKSMELLKVAERVLHPSFSYQDGFELERGLATNYELKIKVSEKGLPFFDKVFDTGTKAAVFPHTRSDMSYITAVVNSIPDPVAIRFANLEGDKFIHIQDPDQANRNLILVRRAVGYIQLFRAKVSDEPSFLSRTAGFEDWADVTGELFDLNKDEHLTIAAFLNANVLREVTTDASSEATGG